MSNDTLYGARQVVVGLKSGGTQTVRVRELTVRQLEGYLTAYRDEAARIELVCDQPAGWADGLSRESFVEVVGVDTEINRGFFEAWKGRRDADARLAVDPLQTDLFQAAMREALVELLSPVKDLAQVFAARALSSGSSPMSAPPAV